MDYVITDNQLFRDSGFVQIERIRSIRSLSSVAGVE